MKRISILVLAIVLLISPMVHGESSATKEWILERGYLGQGGLKPESKINRAELATVVIRLMGLENSALSFRGKPEFKDIEDFQGGWAVGYISIAKREGIMAGKTSDYFDPKGNVTYVELLTMFMRLLGYTDNVDFVNYPHDYYQKALELDLADMYIPLDTEIYRKTVLDTLVKVLNSDMKGESHRLYDILSSLPQEKPKPQVQLKDLRFNTTISGLFKGTLVGEDDFTGYRVSLLDGRGNLIHGTALGKGGDFSITGFDVSVLARMAGYKYEVYDSYDVSILSDFLE
ncbi:MAG: S-layer homology domain-containing protein [Tissierellaceae bacterium]|nr:S-layer homology domain-containing protein [Tissierellaceae bacterium]